MKTRIIFFASALAWLVFLSSCINDPINSYTAAKYFSLAEDAEAKGHLMDARIFYSRSYINTRLGHMPPDVQSHSLYEWARVSGYIGYFEDANQGFTDVIGLIDKSEGKAESLRSPTYCEQARLLRDNGEDQKAIPIYAKAVLELEKQKADETYARAFAVFLDDYEQSLRSIGAKEDADRVAVRSAVIKEKHKDDAAGNPGSQKFGIAGRAAQNRNDWRAAKINWWRAVDSNECAQAKPAVLAVAYYEYGRSLGVVGELEAAEIYLKKALKADQESGGDYFFDLSELGRLNYDQKKFPEAIAYYEQDIAVLDARNWEQKSPADLLVILGEYSDCLKSAGRDVDAKKADERIAAITTKNSVLRAHSERTPYGKNPKPQQPPGEQAEGVRF